VTGGVWGVGVARGCVADGGRTLEFVRTPPAPASQTFDLLAWMADGGPLLD
jgi:hypothetical protein